MDQGAGKGRRTFVSCCCFSGLFILFVVLVPNIKNKGLFSLLENK